MAVNINERAWDLYRDIRDQRAGPLKSYEETLWFVRIRQSETPQLIEPIAKALWELTERLRGDMNPTWR